jgi:DNA processing protein
LTQQREGTIFEEKELISWLQMIRSSGVGPITFYELVSFFGSPQAVIENWSSIEQKFPKKYKRASLKEVEDEILAHEKLGARLITRNHPSYPFLFQHIPDAPPVLSVLGNLSILKDKMIAIVGARNASTNGRHFALQLAKDLGQKGWKIASGLARGIDAAAHEGSLETGTIGVVAGGINVVYPLENHALYKKIQEKGVLISEIPWGEEPQASHFPRRNRLISGLSQGTVVVEAAFKSGSLLTAHYAADQNREVFAVPGFPLDPRCRGTNLLLKQGAHLVESAKDILDVLGEETTEKLLQNRPKQKDEILFSADEGQKRILEQLSSTPLSVDQVILQTGFSATQVWGCLSQLEIEGKIQRYPGNQVSLLLSQ